MKHEYSEEKSVEFKDVLLNMSTRKDENAVSI